MFDFLVTFFSFFCNPQLITDDLPVAFVPTFAPVFLPTFSGERFVENDFPELRHQKLWANGFRVRLLFLGGEPRPAQQAGEHQDEKRFGHRSFSFCWNSMVFRLDMSSLFSRFLS